MATKNPDMIAAAYTVTKVKTFRAMEGSGFNATLCRNGVAVADVDDAGNGGPIDIHWKDQTAQRVHGTEWGHNWQAEDRAERMKDIQITRPMTPEEARFAAFVMTQPDQKGHGFTLKPTMELLASDLVNAELDAKSLKRRMANAAWFTEGGKVYSIKFKPGVPVQKLYDHIAAKHPAARIMNTMPLAEAVAVFRSTGA